MLEALIIYLSIIFGSLIHVIAKEEIKLGKKYIALAKNILIILASVSLIYLNLGLSSILFLLLGFVIFIFLKNIYLVIGAAAFLSLFAPNPVLSLSFISLLAMVHSSLSSPNKKTLISNSVYFILPFSLVLIETFIKGNLDIFIGFVAGGLLAQLKGP